MSFFEENCPEMDRYLENNASAEPDILKRLRKETFQKTTQPHMISGYQQGRLLTIISKLMQPKNVLEIGTFTGYATLSLAEGLHKEGKITTLDVNEELAYLPKKYFAESTFSSQIDFQLKDAKISSIITLSEESRRMQDMMKMYAMNGMGGMDMNMFAADQTLTLNANNELVKYIFEHKDSENVPMFCEQLYDLAVLSNHPLSVDEMTKFVERSNKIMMLLAK